MLKLGRLDNLTEPQRIELENKISALGSSDILKKFHDILYSIGYSFPSPVSTFEVGGVFGYGQELALHKVCEIRHVYGYECGRLDIDLTSTFLEEIKIPRDEWMNTVITK